MVPWTTTRRAERCCAGPQQCVDLLLHYTRQIDEGGEQVCQGDSIRDSVPFRESCDGSELQWRQNLRHRISARAMYSGWWPCTSSSIFESESRSAHPEEHGNDEIQVVMYAWYIGQVVMTASIHTQSLSRRFQCKQDLEGKHPSASGFLKYRRASGHWGARNHSMYFDNMGFICLQFG